MKQNSRMLSLTDGLPRKSQLSCFTALVFHQTVILLLLTESCGGQSQVVGPSQPIVTLVGDDVILPCHLEPAADVVSQSLEWGRLDLEPRFVHVWHQGQDLLENQNPSYQGRTSVSTEDLKQGDLSLKLSAVKHSDTGTYRCYLPTLSKAATVKLIVGSVSSPVIAGIHINSSIVVLDCGSKGWYPEPEVLWLDAEGNLLSAGPTETVRGPDDLYTVSSRVTVEKRHSNSFTCRVQQKDINQTRETYFHVSAECLPAPSCSAARVGIISVVFLTLICAAAFFVWKWRQNKIKDAEKQQQKKRETEQLLAKHKEMKDVEEKKVKLEEAFQRTEEEQRHVDEVFKDLEEQQKVLKKLREQLIHQKNDTEKEKDELEKKVQLVEKETEGDKAQGYFKLKELMLQDKQRQKQERKEQETLHLNLQKLFHETQRVSEKIKKRKEELEKCEEEISVRLKETEKRKDDKSDETERKQET